MSGTVHLVYNKKKKLNDKYELLSFKTASTKT